MTEQPARRTGGLDRRSLLRNGLVIGLGASAIGAASAGLAGTADAVSTAVASTPDPQPNWWWCYACHGLFFSDSHGDDNGVCALGYIELYGTKHGSEGSSNYAVWNTYAGTDLQFGWTWCNACQLLFWGEETSSSACPAKIKSGVAYQKSPHNHNPTNYGLLYNTSGAGLQTGWYFCKLCKGIYWGDNGLCIGNPLYGGASLGPHDGSGSYNYAMTFA
jgi:hypothetical protein